MSIDRTKEREQSYCHVRGGRHVFAGPRSKQEFDDIPLPEIVHDWKACETTTLIKADGQQWERRLHSKCIEGGADGVNVVLQWSDERPIGSEA
ncbi:MAG: hypothetical protein GAK28_03194 [Luteibacter sp.]|uniref:hypothetical protein n=1 Tax=Luteibacter sp. TaxID=1886636 RepID=UPI0013861BAF|nr:hypothetical protein [Luteibacter sp.]KAF1005442.1 MAG: hypothetical protein GAK28_03194 [Luteibacter sp.]